VELHDRGHAQGLAEGDRRDAVRVGPRAEQHVEATLALEHVRQHRGDVEARRERVAEARHVERARVLDVDAVDPIAPRQLRELPRRGPLGERARPREPGDAGQDLDLALARQRRELLPVERRRQRLRRVGKDLRDDEDAHRRAAYLMREQRAIRRVFPRIFQRAGRSFIDEPDGLADDRPA
jgi:hypothetical protein